MVVYVAPDNAQYFGEFVVTSGKIRYTDPCYMEDTQPENAHEAVNGRWRAYMQREGREGRVAAIHVYSDEYDTKNVTWRRGNEVWVDSGQAGFYDAQEKPYDGSDKDEDNWAESQNNYWKICNLTCEDDGAGCMPWGAFAQSGYGDGSYESSIAYNSDGKMVAGTIVFIEPDYEDEDDYYQEDEQEYEEDEQEDEEKEYVGDPD